MKKTALITLVIVSLLSMNSLSARTLYVDQFASILGDEIKENILLSYAQDNGIESLILYELHIVHRNLDLPNPATNYILANFISKAKTEYGMESIGATVENSDFFENVIDAYNRSRSEASEKFDVYNLEFEYWSQEATGPEGYYCTTYLEPNGLPCTVLGAFEYYVSILETMTRLADNSEHDITTEAYVGWTSEGQADTIGSMVDRVLLHAYVTDPNRSFSYAEKRLKEFADGTPDLELSIIFSAEPNFMQEWLSNNSMTAAEDIFISDWAGESEDWTNNVNLVGFTYFAYSFLFDGVISPIDEEDPTLYVYPTLVKDNLTIESKYPIDKVTLLDVYGNEMLSHTVDQSNRINLDLKSFSVGIYYVNLISQSINETVVVSKFRD